MHDQPSSLTAPPEPTPSLGARRRYSFHSASTPEQATSPDSTCIVIAVPSVCSPVHVSPARFSDESPFFEPPDPPDSSPSEPPESCGAATAPPIGQSASVQLLSP